MNVIFVRWRTAGVRKWTIWSYLAGEWDIVVNIGEGDGMARQLEGLLQAVIIYRVCLEAKLWAAKATFLMIHRCFFSRFSRKAGYRTVCSSAKGMASPKKTPCLIKKLILFAIKSGLQTYSTLALNTRFTCGPMPLPTTSGLLLIHSATPPPDCPAPPSNYDN